MLLVNQYYTDWHRLKKKATAKIQIHYYAWAESEPEYAEKQMRCDHNVMEIECTERGIFKHSIAHSSNPFQGSMTNNYQTL